MADKTKYFDYATVKEMLYDLEFEGKEVEPSDYPYIEIADEHGRCIDADTLQSLLNEDLSKRDSDVFTARGVLRILNKTPTILERTI